MERPPTIDGEQLMVIVVMIALAIFFWNMLKVVFTPDPLPGPPVPERPAITRHTDRDMTR